MQSVSSTPGMSPPLNTYKPPSTASGPNIGPFTAEAPEDPTVKEFTDYVSMTPAQKMRASILSGMGLKESDLDKMSPEERKKVEDKIKETIKAEIEKGDKDHKGVLLDVIA